MKKLPLILLAALLAGCQSSASSQPAESESESETTENQTTADIAQMPGTPIDLPYQPEKTAYDWFITHGFNDIELEYQHDENGESIGETKIADPENMDRHPVYHAVYTDPDGNEWQFFLSGGSIAAYLTDYPNVAVSETNRMIVFDGDTKQFMEEIPNENIIFIEVGKFLPETLEYAYDEAMERLGNEKPTDEEASEIPVFDEEALKRVEEKIENS